MPTELIIPKPSARSVSTPAKKSGAGPMRILIHDYAGHAFPTDLSRELGRRGHQVCHAYASNLVTPRGPLAKRQSDPENLQFRELPMDGRYREWKYSFLKRRSLEIRYGKAAANFVLDFRPDLVLSGNTPTDSQRHLIRATHACGGRFISWVQDFYGIAIDKILRRKVGACGWPVGAYYRHLDGRLLRRSDYCIGITQDFEPLLKAERVAPGKISTIPNWAIIDELPLRPKENPWSRRLGLDDKFVFLYTGTMGMKHNPALIAALCRTMRPHLDVQIVVVSEGPGADWLQEQKRIQSLRNLLLLPYQPFEDLPDMLGTGDVLLAILEPDAGVFSVPSKVLTYLCAGRPTLLAVPLENLAARMVTESGGGVVTPPQDEAAFIEHAHRLYAERKVTEHLGIKARAYAEEHFGIRRIADQFERVFNDVTCSPIGKRN